MDFKFCMHIEICPICGFGHLVGWTDAPPRQENIAGQVHAFLFPSSRLSHQAAFV